MTNRQLAIIQLPVCETIQRADAIMSPPSVAGQLMKDDVASQWSSGYQENMN